jgi:hypothetical protein
MATHPPTPTQRILSVHSADELRDELPNSGVFDMTDCTVELGCPLDSHTEEIEKMVNLIESMIHVVDVKVSGIPQPHLNDLYTITITDVPFNRAINKKEK